MSQASASTAQAATSAAASEAARLQRIVDRAESADLIAVPERSTDVAIRSGPDGEVVGFRFRAALHRFQIRLAPVSRQQGVRAANTAAEVVGHLDLEWRIVPWDHYVLPEASPPPTALDPTRTQRFAIQEARFSFGDGGDGFRSFGSGRTLPSWVDGEPRLTAAGLGTFTGGFGRLDGFEGNYTLCGELSVERGFEGHVMVRILDPGGVLRAAGPLHEPAPVPDPSPDVTYLTWIARKGHGEEWENFFSFDPAGQPRGVNIPVELRRVEADLADVAGSLAFQELRTGGVVGKEIGFGREVRPRTGRNGNARTPFQFEGVSEYHFYDPEGRVVGALTANFLEGRSIQVELPGAPDQPALRFGYYGAIVGGEGCFAGAQGTIYGTAGSVFAPPPFEHVITNLYVARLHDPRGRHRAVATGGGP